MIRLGLCCIFREEAIRFRRTTARYIGGLSRESRYRHLSDICLHNADSLMAALRFCAKNGIKDFRVNSQILPLKTHPEFGYRVDMLPEHREIRSRFENCGRFCRENDLRTTFHPDQFIVLSSPDREIVRRAEAELIYHAEMSEWISADVINLHGGGAYGDKKKTLKRLAANIRRLPDSVKSRLTLENDDRIYTPADLLPVCMDIGVPLVYDIHHHRCLSDGIDTDGTVSRAMKTWDREPLFHVSSPLYRRGEGDPRIHHDFIDIEDFPLRWGEFDLTVEVEAKAKELAVLKLKAALESMGVWVRK